MLHALARSLRSDYSAASIFKSIFGARGAPKRGAVLLFFKFGAHFALSSIFRMPGRKLLEHSSTDNSIRMRPCEACHPITYGNYDSPRGTVMGSRDIPRQRPPPRAAVGIGSRDLKSQERYLFADNPPP